MFYFAKTKTQTFFCFYKMCLLHEFIIEIKVKTTFYHILSFSPPQEYSHDLRQLPLNQGYLSSKSVAVDSPDSTTPWWSQQTKV